MDQQPQCAPSNSLRGNKGKGKRSRSSARGPVHTGGSLKVPSHIKKKEKVLERSLTVTKIYSDNFVKKVDKEKFQPINGIGDGRNCAALEEQTRRPLGNPDSGPALSENKLGSLGVGGLIKRDQMLEVNHSLKGSSSMGRSVTGPNCTASTAAEAELNVLLTTQQIQQLIQQELQKSEEQFKANLTTIIQEQMQKSEERTKANLKTMIRKHVQQVQQIMFQPMQVKGKGKGKGKASNS